MSPHQVLINQASVQASSPATRWRLSQTYKLEYYLHIQEADYLSWKDPQGWATPVTPKPNQLEIPKGHLKSTNACQWEILRNYCFAE